MMEGFVAKLNSTGLAILYATYLGGHGNDGFTDIAVDTAGYACLAGGTWSPALGPKGDVCVTGEAETPGEFPTVNPSPVALS
jgi:hypothetical protein